MRMNDWHNGLISDLEVLDDLQFALHQVMHKMATDACERNDPCIVHFIVATERKIERDLRKINEQFVRFTR